jgi:hypothetical protein
VAVLGIGAPSASAIDTCPNAVFRTGPSAKLPDCRAYELVSPVNEDGLRAAGYNAFNAYNSFEFPLLSEARDSVMFHTNEGTISGFPGNGFEDQYMARRTSTGWQTEYFGPTATQSSRPLPGGISPDHTYSFFNAGSGDYELEPESTLQAPFGGHDADYLRKPNGEFELIATGSLGSGQHSQGLLITPGGKHILFISATKLEPLAKESEEGFEYGNQFGTIYDRSPGGPTKVVSLMPDGTTPPGLVHFVGTSTDAADVSFSESTTSGRRYFVRHDNTITKEWARENGVQVGQELTCSNGAQYQWLRNGAPIGGATNATYITTAADAGAVLQCQVTQTNSEGSTVRASSAQAIVAPFAEKDPPEPNSSSVSIQVAGKYAESVTVGDKLDCDPESWTSSPTFTYQWFRNGKEIEGATSSSYTLVGADKNAAVECRVTATNADGAAVSFSNLARVAGLPPTATTKPVISNITNPGSGPAAGDELSCATGTWTNSPTFGYAWLRNGLPIGGASASTYTLVAADEEASLQCAVTGTNSEGAAKAISEPLVAEPAPATAPPILQTEGELYGRGAVGSELYAEQGSWSGEPTVTYQWLRNGKEIAGATSQSYTPTAEDLGTVVQVQITGTNAGGATAEINSSQAKYVTAGIPDAFPEFHPPGLRLTYGGTFNGQIFYVNNSVSNRTELVPGDLFSYDIADGSTTRITHAGDAIFVNVSTDGSTVYFISESEIGGEGEVGKPNLYVWSRAGDTTKYIATVVPEDLELSGSALAAWTYGVQAPKEEAYALGSSNTRSTPDGSVLLFETEAQLTSFDNTEASPKDCGEQFSEVSGQHCNEIYRYDTKDEELTCVSCGEGVGPATGEASMLSKGAVGPLHPPANLSEDGSTAVFETTEDLLPQDGNLHRDVYRWKEGSGLALISTGQSPRHSFLYAVSPEANDILFTTQEQLLPQDENGGTPRIYDARVDGGFPPPESTVTEPCSGDTCQANPSAAPEAPQVASSSLSGGGNVPPSPQCGRGRRVSTRNGKTRCVTRKHRHHRKHTHRRGGAKRGAGR